MNRFLPANSPIMDVRVAAVTVLLCTIGSPVDAECRNWCTIGTRRFCCDFPSPRTTTTTSTTTTTTTNPTDRTDMSTNTGADTGTYTRITKLGSKPACRHICTSEPKWNSTTNTYQTESFCCDQFSMTYKLSCPPKKRDGWYEMYEHEEPVSCYQEEPCERSGHLCCWDHSLQQRICTEAQRHPANSPDCIEWCYEQIFSENLMAVVLNRICCRFAQAKFQIVCPSEWDQQQGSWLNWLISEPNSCYSDNDCQNSTARCCPDAHWDKSICKQAQRVLLQ